MKIGPTGRFPDGKLDATDDGELTMKISTTDNGLIRMDFGTKVSWFAITPSQAIELAAILVKHATAQEM